MFNRDAYIWRDESDGDNFHFGYKSSGRYYLTFAIFADYICNMFGTEMLPELNKICDRHAPGTPIPIELTMRIKE